jgi:F0F1-type ATP synthase epsilon subunit
MSDSDNSAQIVAVIQGGAAKGNPEYQGIFGDIDFTIFTRPGSGADDSAIKAKILDFFRKRGYPLAKSKEKPSSMDSEVFVQPWGRFDAAMEERIAVLKDVNEKRGDPTRFYSEAGTKWFLNNLHYSGKVLWAGGDETTKWVDIEPGEGHGLALDMIRYMGFLTDPKYSKSNLDSITDPARKKAVLEDALKKTKYTIRLIDAYEIAHSDGEVTGNDNYNKRKDNVDSEDREASYHWQIYKNAEALIKAEREGKTKTVFEEGDAEIIRYMAEMKLKGENPSPWDAFKKAGMDDAAALEMAERIVRRTEQLAPKILAYTTQQWNESHQRALESSDDSERKRAFNNINRTISTMRNIMDIDDYSASALMVPPDISIEDVDERRKKHEEAISQKMSEAMRLREKLKVDLAKIRAMYEPSSDIMGNKSKEEVKKMLDERDRQLSMLRGEVNLTEQHQMLPWFRHLMSVTIPLAE